LFDWGILDTFTFVKKQGLYDPRFEKGSCGIGMISHLKGEKSFAIVSQGLEILRNLVHRGAQGADPRTGDGAGILTQIPHRFFESVMKSEGNWESFPNAGDYAVGVVFLPKEPLILQQYQKIIEMTFRKKNLSFLGWRIVPVNSSHAGIQAQETEPTILHCFIERQGIETLEFERKLYLARRIIEKEILALKTPASESFHFASLSTRTLVYKGMLMPAQVQDYFADLTDPRFESAIAVVHSRFSTNTFPSWPLAHPYRYLCHNGEINTIQGNLNWMRARQGKLKSPLFGPELKDAFPIIKEDQSDSASLDNALEFLVLGGRSLPHAMMMLIPEPWIYKTQMSKARRAFYQYHSAMMEPWDGPAAVCFTDGLLVGATLDRNGLRPCRYWITTDDRVILASETGVLPVAPNQIKEKGRLEPGKMFLVDTVQGRIIDDEEIKSELQNANPYRAWVKENRIDLDDVPNVPLPTMEPSPNLKKLQRAFGITEEEIKMVIRPMSASGEEPTLSMGNDTPLAVLSERPQLLFKYFRQLFAQVTNPPIDPIREALVMSLSTGIGPRPNLLTESPEAWRNIKIAQPILTNEDMAKIRSLTDPNFKHVTLKILFKASEGPRGLRKAVAQLCRQASKEVRNGCRVLILSDKGVNTEWAPIPSLLAIAAVQHHLVRKSLRAECGLVVESGEPRDVHHFACLIGFGAGTVNPYLAFETIASLNPEKNSEANTKFIYAIHKGLLKVFSKMGISTIQSYCGAQIFEAVGVSSELIKQYFTGTPSRIEGVGLEQIAEETLKRHSAGFVNEKELEIGGENRYRIHAEHHEWNPITISKLQHATRNNDAKTFREFSSEANGEGRMPTTLRGLLEFDFSKESIPLSEVEPASEIVKRFTTGAMSFGALGIEAHETLAVAMNRIGAKSNSGEGGEDSARFKPETNGDSKNSAIKQIASARFGVTAHYLVNARELQIKMAQGAKPGEGGQLPGPKVDAAIARLRYSTPGVGLISPPPHHDIYSIEDLAQLIFDLKNVNSRADISVKLVSEVGIGTIAAGVAKARADKILVSGDTGGTGASALSSIKYAGLPWELGLAEVHQTLILNNLRGRVKLETDGQLKTGRDVVVATLLGAEEYGFSTAPLIVEGCIMMRKCHLNTCPVGIATQDPSLRAKFSGQPEHVINFFFFVAEEVRELMAKLGFRTIAEMIGRTERLKTQPLLEHWKARELDLSPLLYQSPDHLKNDRSKSTLQDHQLQEILDHELIRSAQASLLEQKSTHYRGPVKNSNRTIGAMLSGEVARMFGEKGLPPDTIKIELQGSAGQSFGAFLAPGITLTLTGESNDYVGKGLSGGKIIITPDEQSITKASETIILGNTALYGATSGEVYFQGCAGERFAVRNSGATAVVEGVGDHGCEYMTGGSVVVIGKTGKNFAAGMSGGIAYVLDENEDFSDQCNRTLVELEEVLSVEDTDELKALLERHVLYTESLKAKTLLNDWKNARTKFVKVIPSEYKRVLLEQKQNAEKNETLPV
jgi:glutamate synthase (NADPH/NADH) large chain